jgi:hypothetical protein
VLLCQEENWKRLILNEARKLDKQNMLTDQIKMMKDQMKKIYFKKGQMISFGPFISFQ